MFNFSEPRTRRRPSLTPMIDVVFLLLVFFMLAARFSLDIAVPLGMAGGIAEPEGTPRLVTVRAAGLALNGVPVASEALAERLAETGRPSTDPVFVQPDGEVSLQELVAAIDSLRSAGLTSIVVVGQP